MSVERPVLSFLETAHRLNRRDILDTLHPRPGLIRDALDFPPVPRCQRLFASTLQAVYAQNTVQFLSTVPVRLGKSANISVPYKVHQPEISTKSNFTLPTRLCCSAQTADTKRRLHVIPIGRRAPPPPPNPLRQPRKTHLARLLPAPSPPRSPASTFPLSPPAPEETSHAGGDTRRSRPRNDRLCVCM